MDFSKYKSSFCIDWLEVEITLEENSNWQTIRRKVIEASGRFQLNINDEETERKINPTYVTAVTSNKFKFRLYDIKRKKQVIDTINALHDEKNISEVKFTAIEIARDFRGKNKSSDLANQEHAELLAYIYKFERQKTDVNHRIYNINTGYPEAVPSNERLIERFIAGDISLYIGSHEIYKDEPASPIAKRLYNKKLDRKLPLEPSKYSARFEVTFQNEGMLFHDIDGFKSFKFESVAKHYYLSKPIAMEMTALGELIFKTKKRVGEPQSTGTVIFKKPSGQRVRVGKYSKGIEADRTENKVARDKLKGLTKSLNRNMN